MDQLFSGILQALEPSNLLWGLLGVTMGTIVGAIPGLGPTTGIALLLPLIFGMNPLSALLLLVGIYQGAMYGGRISSILINVPGDAAAVVTTFEGYPLRQQGKAGLALSLSAIASFFGGFVGFLGLALIGTVMARFALRFGPPEYFALMLFALVTTSGITDKRPLKAIAMVILGLLIAMVGNDFVSGTQRLTFGFKEMWEGIDFIPVAVGVFGLSEVLLRLESKQRADFGDMKFAFSKQMFPKVREVIANAWAMVRGTVIGFLIGVLPGAGGTVATFLTYNAEKRISKHPEKFGTGVTQGLAAPEASNNASIGGALIPLLTLGVPGSGTCAILLGGLIMLGLNPGPLLFQKSPDIVWGVIGGLMVANVMLLILNTMCIPFFVTMIKKVEPYLVPMIAALCVFGVYVLNYRLFDVGVMIIFGLAGYMMRKLGYPIAPLVLALVLGQIIEQSLRQSLMLAHNHVSIFFTRPISGTIMVITIIVLIFPAIKWVSAALSTKTSRSGSISGD